MTYIFPSLKVYAFFIIQNRFCVAFDELILYNVLEIEERGETNENTIDFWFRIPILIIWIYIIRNFLDL